MHTILLLLTRIKVIFLLNNHFIPLTGDLVFNNIRNLETDQFQRNNRYKNGNFLINSANLNLNLNTENIKSEHGAFPGEDWIHFSLVFSYNFHWVSRNISFQNKHKEISSTNTHINNRLYFIITIVANQIIVPEDCFYYATPTLHCVALSQQHSFISLVK